jgi:hypothetical protein
MREHGARACYMFGPNPGSNRANGCRCEPCSNANRTYARDRDRASRRPDVEVEPAYIDATETRRHIQWLAKKGVGLRTIAARTRLSRTTITQLRDGARTRCTPATAELIAQVWPGDAADRACIDAAPTWRLVDDLLAHGHTRTSIARALGSTAKAPALRQGSPAATRAAVGQRARRPGTRSG